MHQKCTVCMKGWHTRLGPGELAALSGLGPLRHLDLDLVRVGQVVGGHAEPPGGHLLDGRAAVVREATGVLAALPGVGPAADLVHLGGWIGHDGGWRWWWCSLCTCV